MKFSVIVLLAILLVFSSCVPEAEDYTVPEEPEAETTIEEEIKEIQEKAREEARQKIEEQNKIEEEARKKAEQKEKPPEFRVEYQNIPVPIPPLELYPDFFKSGRDFKSNFITIVGSEAPASYVVALSNLIARTEGEKPVGFSRLSSEISDISKFNAIIVGNPCNNLVISRMHGNPFPCENANIPDDKGMIKIYKSSTGNIALVATGMKDEDVINAVNIIGTSALNGITTSKICVKGSDLVAC